MPHSPEDLADRTHRLLKGLPDRAAPASLEQRVLAAIAQRSHLPWWRRPYAGWPALMRLAFFVGSALAAAAAVYVAGRLFWSLQSASGAVAAGRIALDDIFGDSASVLARLRGPWLYAGAFLLASAYAALVGVASALYRHLIRPASPSL